MNIQLSKPDLHISSFQQLDTSNLKNDRTLLSVTTDREKRIETSDLDKLSSPGSFNFNDGVELTGSNTRHLFKGLYGETPLTFLFFSKDNIDNIQNLIRHTVYKELNVVIDPQDSTELMIIMRSLFLEYHRHPKLIDQSMDEKTLKILLKQYSDEVARLNELVINETVPRVLSQLQQYVDYLRDSAAPRIPLEKPESVTVTGTRAHRSITSVLTGNNL